MVALNYKQDHVIVNKYSRPGDPLIRVQAIVIHYTANPGANALMHANFFDGPDGGAYRYAGAHIFVDRKEALEVIPLDEVGYHANERKAGPLLSALKATADYYPQGNANLLTIGIEMCIEKDGTFHPDTIERTRLVIKRLQKQFPQLADTQNRIVRHYDITGKNCPAPFVANKKAWQAFLASVDQPAETKSAAAVIAKELPKVTSFSKYPRWIRITKDTGVYNSADISGRERTLGKGAELKVYGETYAAWAAGDGKFIQKKDAEELAQVIITGGLTPENVAKVERYYRDRKVEGSLEFVGDGNPFAKATLKGDELQDFREWLDAHGWWHKVTKK